MVLSPPFEKFAQRLQDFLNTQPTLQAISSSLPLALPLIMVGAVMLMLRNLPWTAAQSALDEILGPAGIETCEALVSGTLGVASLAILGAFTAIRTIKANDSRTGLYTSPALAAVVVLSCFFILAAPANPESWHTVLSLSNGFTLCLGTGIASTAVFLALARRSALRLSLDGIGNPFARDAMSTMPAAVLTLLLFALAKALLLVSGIDDLQETLRQVIVQPFLNTPDGFGFATLYTLLSQAIWLLGAHGPNLLVPVEAHALIPAALHNAEALASGLTPAHIVTKPFVDVFTRIGGSGSTLSLILAVVLVSRDRGTRKLCLLALGPALFNVNEPLLFGLPLVLNPTYALPFLLVPALQAGTAWLATILELIPHTVVACTWTTPPLINAYLTTGSLSGTAMQAVNIGLGTLIYLPFVRLSDTSRQRQDIRVMQSLLRTAVNCETRPERRKCMDAPGDTGHLAKILAHDLVEALRRQDQLYLVYQPQHDAVNQTITGVEALLRWKHPVFGHVAPPVTIALAEENGLIHALGLYILNEACAQRGAWIGRVPEALTVSVNVVPEQLRVPDFRAQVMTTLRDHNLRPDLLELEITESSALEPEQKLLDTLAALQEQGVRISIDDFGMGHASLRYLRAFPVDKIKIDRSLTDLDSNSVNEQIVRSVIALCHGLNIATIVEGVELREQVDRFMNLGCTIFQGYYYSKPAPGELCLEIIRQTCRKTSALGESRSPAD